MEPFLCFLVMRLFFQTSNNLKYNESLRSSKDSSSKVFFQGNCSVWIRGTQDVHVCLTCRRATELNLLLNDGRYAHERFDTESPNISKKSLASAPEQASSRSHSVLAIPDSTPSKSSTDWIPRASPKNYTGWFRVIQSFSGVRGAGGISLSLSGAREAHEP